MTSAIQIQDRKFWLEFINEYRNHPCLWDKNHVNFSSRKNREKALFNLLKKVRTIRPTAQIDFVKQRINNFRRTFLNEYNKVQEFKKAGSHSYVPSLYYYNHLRFLKEDVQSSEQSEASDEERIFDYDDTNDEFPTESIPLSEFAEEVDFIVTTKVGSNSSSEFYLVPSSSNDGLKNSKRQRMTHNTSESNLGDTEESAEIELEEETESTNAIEIESQYKEEDKSHAEQTEHADHPEITSNFSTELFSTIETNTEDEFDVIAKRVAMHFRKMDQQQCLYAEKLVFDVCISGRLNRLTEYSSLSLPPTSSNCLKDDIEL